MPCQIESRDASKGGGQARAEWHPIALACARVDAVR
eukprot:CAMPEP_0194751134 /NCGR_PEP_ID=MMETSP0323_2-20130528/5244_1 /TAXON_ID=2866 ORGANISM="Crypthecodinium cohnii, Strain Seligo" /NCGR_SAMPLE_ID=MMETSP0323_2 /ASSEMBLY_ACC=CAM_ASM_000346 /LENGTH=35 /DNA_ID= /DNA_START= /DNA_END= /DNA_ORIENTATION=